MTLSIADLQHRYNELLQRARPFDGSYSLQTVRSDDGSPHVELDAEGFHFVTTERGLELNRETFDSPDGLLYAAVSLATFWMGVEFEFRNRDEGKDCRRMIFAKQLELLWLADHAWAARRSEEIAAILRENPYQDRRA
jgi:hypothetical protein